MELEPHRRNNRSDSASSDTPTLVDPAESAPVAFDPISVESFNRYGRGRFVTHTNTNSSVLPFSRSFSRPSIENWIPHRHPEGSLYFMHEKIRIFTDAYLYDGALLAKMNACVTQIIYRLEDKGFRLDSTRDMIDIVLDLVEDGNQSIKCGYYLVNHPTRTIFWMDVFDMSQLSSWKRVPGVTSPSHIGLMLEHEYWLVFYSRRVSDRLLRRHRDLFPASKAITPAVVCELREAIVHGTTDALTSPTTTIPFSVDDLLKMLTLTGTMSSPVEGEEIQSDRNGIDSGSSSALARLMMLFVHERVNHFHWEYAARIDSENSVYDRTPQRSYLMVILSPLLFSAPKSQLRDLRSIFTDDIISQLAWKKYIQKLLSEWQDMTLYASLILNANVGILAVPGSGDVYIGLIASYLSISFGLGSIILGIFLSRKYRLEALDAVTVATASSFKQRSLHALEARAILFSLPYTLMMWGMTTFVSSFLIMAFKIAHIGFSIIMVTTGTALLLTIFGCILPAYGWGPGKIFSTVIARSRARGWTTRVDVRQVWQARDDHAV